MRPGSLRRVAWGPVVAGAAVLAFAAAPVGAATPSESNHAWGDIDSVVAGPGLTGGATQGDATLAVDFGGNGAAATVARSDHDHDARYSQLGHTHDDRYLGLGGGTLSGLLTLTVGDLALLGDGARVVAPQLVSTAPEGTPPLEVASTTKVANLNADTLDGYDASDFALAGSGGAGNFAVLDGSNAFTGVNTFNASTTFGGSASFVNGGANFTLQPFYTGTTSYSLRLMDSRVSATRLVIDQNGRIGIGTTTPTFPLQVVGDVRASGLNLGSGVLGPMSYDLSSALDRTFSFTNSGTGLAHLSVEGNVSAAGLSVQTGNGSARAGSASIVAGDTTRTVATTAAGASSLVFVTPDASSAGCVAPSGPLYVSARAAGTSFTVAVAGATPGTGEAFCFNWWVLN